MPDAITISKTLLKLNPNKSPGPDGLTSGFFKAMWSLIGGEVSDSIRNFFISGFLPTSVNSTILTLVPKHPGASAISDYRPISCCSTLYKAISKILVSKLKPLLPTLILPNQTAFVQGRLLVENTILATELVSGYHRSTGAKKIAIKVDIAKALIPSTGTLFLTAWWGLGFRTLSFDGLKLASPPLPIRLDTMVAFMATSRVREVCAKVTPFLLTYLL